MSPRFGKSEDKAAQDEAATAEVARLVALAPRELAGELLGAFGADGPKGRGPNGGINLLQVMAFTLESFPRGAKYLPQLEEPTREGLQALEHAELVVRATRQNGSWFSITRLGETALAEGTAKQYLQPPG